MAKQNENSLVWTIHIRGAFWHWCWLPFRKRLFANWKSRCHFQQQSTDAICNICTVKRIWTVLNQVVGVAIVYRTRMLAVTGSKHGDSFLLLFCFLFQFSFLLLKWFLVCNWIRIRVRVRVSISCISAIKILSSSWKRQQTVVGNGIDWSKWKRSFTEGKIASPKMLNVLVWTDNLNESEGMQFLNEKTLMWTESKNWDQPSVSFTTRCAFHLLYAHQSKTPKCVHRFCLIPHLMCESIPAASTHPPANPRTNPGRFEKKQSNARPCGQFLLVNVPPPFLTIVWWLNARPTSPSDQYTKILVANFFYKNDCFSSIELHKAGHETSHSDWKKTMQILFLFQNDGVWNLWLWVLTGMTTGYFFVVRKCPRGGTLLNSKCLVPGTNCASNAGVYPGNARGWNWLAYCNKTKTCTDMRSYNLYILIKCLNVLN